MKVKDQIRTRREQLGMTIDELARRMGVSGQAVRHWESGRSFPGKSKGNALEVALSMAIDWTEGVRKSSSETQISALIKKEDLDLMLLICRLPTPAKTLVGDLVQMHLDALDGGRRAIQERVLEEPQVSFQERRTQKPVGAFNGSEGSSQSTTGRKSPSPRKKSA